SSLVRLILTISLGLNLAALITTANDQFIYSGFSGSNLAVDDTATITPDGLLELTNGTAYQKGHAFHPAPFRLRDSTANGVGDGKVRSFSVAFVFGIVSAYPDFSAHGMAFVIAPRRNFSDALPAKYLGLTNVQNDGNASNSIFAVELDTIQSVEFKDINANHVGIDINGLQSLRSYNAGYYDDESGDFRGMKLISREAMQVWIDYHGERKEINVTLAPFDMAKPARPLLSASYDLSTVLTELVYLGFSAATGRVNSRHFVLGWSLGVSRQAPAIDMAKLPKLPRVGPKPRSKVLDIVLPIVTATFVLGLGGILVLVMRRRSRYAELREDWEVEFGPHRFLYKDLFRATDGFKDKHLLGAGGFGRVYRGVLETSKLEVAVKRVSHESRQGMREFIAEITSIGRIRHRNLVELLGYCRRKGLLYLHERWEKVVIHRDIKASNVLLDKDMNAQLGDFGLARLYDHGADSQTTHVVGTMGYLAPELIRTGRASPLTDMFAFGIFLLEVACGQKPIKENAQGGQIALVDWVLEHWRDGTLMETVDARLQGEFDIDQAGLVLTLALMCSHLLASARPGIGQVMRYLTGVTPLPELTPTDVLTLMQNKGFDESAMSYPDLVSSFGTISTLSGGR
uniref:non-specific serine/threonine protein kinase n=1 Tax=Aegilops tauschii subsp. strangulata TaxID=200361 RepID=A0A453NZ96_AEGTS